MSNSSGGKKVMAGRGSASADGAETVPNRNGRRSAEVLECLRVWRLDELILVIGEGDELIDAGNV